MFCINKYMFCINKYMFCINKYMFRIYKYMFCIYKYRFGINKHMSSTCFVLTSTFCADNCRIVKMVDKLQFQGDCFYN